MGCVNDPPEGGKYRFVAWENKAEIEGWLRAVEENADDLHGVVVDRVRKKRKRVLSRHEAKRKVRAAWRALSQLFEAAMAGLRRADPVDLPPSPPPPVEPEPGEAPSSERRVLQPPSGDEGT